MVYMDVMEHGLKRNESELSSTVAIQVSESSPRQQEVISLSSLRYILDRKPEMKEQFLSFMERIIKNSHTELALPLKVQWYLPSMGL